MTKKESTAVVKTSTTSNPYEQVANQLQATSVSGTSVAIRQTTGSSYLLDGAYGINDGRAGFGGVLTGRPYERAEIPPSVLRDLWITKFGNGWIDAIDIPEDYTTVQRQLWFAGLIQKMYRPDTGREVWRVSDAF